MFEPSNFLRTHQCPARGAAEARLGRGRALWVRVYLCAQLRQCCGQPAGLGRLALLRLLCLDVRPQVGSGMSKVKMKSYHY